MTIEDKIKLAVREVPNFPKPGILFKDITPLFQQPTLCKEIAQHLSENFANKIDAVAGIESRGFFFGFLIAHQLQIPFIPIRKAGKLPYKTNSATYDLEYGTATVEVNVDAFKPDMRVLIHDDLLATGGTAEAAARLIKQQYAKVEGFSFLIALGFLNGSQKLIKHSENIHILASY